MININKKKNIGSVIYIVEGREDDIEMLKKIKLCKINIFKKVGIIICIQ